MCKFWLSWEIVCSGNMYPAQLSLVVSIAPTMGEDRRALWSSSRLSNNKSEVLWYKWTLCVSVAVFVEMIPVEIIETKTATHTERAKVMCLLVGYCYRFLVYTNGSLHTLLLHHKWDWCHVIVRIITTGWLLCLTCRRFLESTHIHRCLCRSCHCTVS